MSSPYQQGPPPGGQYPGAGYPSAGTFGGYQPPPPPRGMLSRGAFWLSLAAVVVIAAGIVVGLVLTSGGGGKQEAGGDGGPTGSTDQTGDVSTSSSPSGFGTSADVSSPTDVPTSAGESIRTSSTGDGSEPALGKAISAKGQDDGERLSITATAFDNAARSTSPYDKPPAGQHFVAVKWLLDNTGTTHYQDAVDNCVDVSDSNGRTYKITIVSGVSSGSVIDSVDIAPGGSRYGWSVFAVPNGTTIVRTSYTMDSGYAGGGSWKI